MHAESHPNQFAFSYHPSDVDTSLSFILNLLPFLKWPPKENRKHPRGQHSARKPQYQPPQSSQKPLSIRNKPFPRRKGMRGRRGRKGKGTPSKHFQTPIRHSLHFPHLLLVQFPKTTPSSDIALLQRLWRCGLRDGTGFGLGGGGLLGELRACFCCCCWWWW